MRGGATQSALCVANHQLQQAARNPAKGRTPAANHLRPHLTHRLASFMLVLNHSRSFLLSFRLSSVSE